MEIIKSSRELTKKEKYMLMQAPISKKMVDADGSRIEVKAWAIYTDANNEGEEKEILAILTPDDEVFATVSPTFKTDFLKMCEIFGAEEIGAVKVCTGTSKAGRTFINAVYDGDEE